ncbi:MAG: hypothetical protein D4R64_18170 [Porphyromonadaceae bacterium]|nr:MAG: hypothetical protein D4R64_18170 [Porphyromonadaceae bacterium]
MKGLFITFTNVKLSQFWWRSATFSATGPEFSQTSGCCWLSSLRFFYRFPWAGKDFTDFSSFFPDTLFGKNGIIVHPVTYCLSETQLNSYEQEREEENREA